VDIIPPNQKQKSHPINTLRALTCWSLLSTGIIGCASVSISSVSLNRGVAPRTGIEQVTISPFTSLGEATPQSTQHLNQATGHIHWGTKAPGQEINRAGQTTAAALAKYLQKHGIPARVSPDKPHEGLWVSGQLVKEDKGSRALRTVVGLGAGRSRLDSRVHVFNLDESAKKPWISALTTGGSNREPGAIFSATPSPILAFSVLAAASTAASLAIHGQKGLTQDANRTGRTIGVLIKAEADKAQGIKPAKHPKLTGRWNHPLSTQALPIPFGSRIHAHSETQFLER